MDADAEMPVLLPVPRCVQLAFVIQIRVRQQRRQLVGQHLEPRPGLEEGAADHRVKHPGAVRQIAGQRRSGRRNVDHQVDQLRVRLEQRKNLNAGWQALEEAVELDDRLVRPGGPLEAVQQLRQQPVEDLPRPFRPQRGIAAPGLDQTLGGLGHRRRRRALAGRREEAFGQGIDPLERLVELGLQPGDIAGAAEHRQAGPFARRLRQVVGLGVLHHLHAVLDLAQADIVAVQRLRILGLDPAFQRQLGQRLPGLAHAQVRVAAAGDQLAGLGEELDLADAAGREFQVAPVQPGGRLPLVQPDLLPDVADFLDGGEVEMAAPDERADFLQEALAGADGPGAGPRLDEGGAFPGPADAFVIAFRRADRDRHGGDRGVGAQPQVGAEDIAVGSQVRQQRHRPAHRLDHLGAHLGQVGAVIAAVVEQADQVDVRGIVQLGRAHLAHGQREQAAGLGQIGLGRAGDAAAGQFRHQRRLHRHVAGGVGQPGQPAGHPVKPPDPAQIGQRHQQRDPLLGGPERLLGFTDQTGLQLGQDAAQGRLRPTGERAPQPVALPHDQAGQIGAASGGAFQQIAQQSAGPVEPLERFGSAVRFERQRQAGDGIREAHGSSVARHGRSGQRIAGVAATANVNLFHMRP